MRLTAITLVAFAFLDTLQGGPITSLVYVPSASGIAVLDSKTASVIASFNPSPGQPCGSGAFSPDGTRLYCTTVFFGGVEVIDLTTRSLIENIFIPSTTTQVHLNGISISPDGNTAWVIDFTSNSVLALNLISKQVVASIAFGSATPIGIASTNDGSKLYVADLDGAQVFVIDTSSLSVVRTIPVGIFPEALRFSPDGTELWIAI